MASETASIWSAIAATFSAVAAITVMIIQRSNMLDAAKPEIILDGWGRQVKKVNDHEYDVITFNKIINAGKGAALHVVINASDFSLDRPPKFAMSTICNSIILWEGN